MTSEILEYIYYLVVLQKRKCTMGWSMHTILVEYAHETRRVKLGEGEVTACLR